MHEETRGLSVGAKVGLFVAFVVVWLGLSFALDKMMGPFHRGGWGMWPILAVGLVFLMITIERTRHLLFIAPVNRRNFVAEVQKQLMHGNVAAALCPCQGVQHHRLGLFEVASP